MLVEPFAQPLSPAALAQAGMVATTKRGPILAALQRCTVDTFQEGDWTELANLLDQGHVVENHGRLLRALHFSDDDYSACAGQVLSTLLGPSFENLPAIARRAGLRPWLEANDPELHTDLYGAGGVTVASVDLAHLADPSAITEHLRRLRSVDPAADPALAIGTAKELIESTVKVLLADLHQPIAKTDDLPALITRMHQARDADPTTVDPADPAAKPVKKILGGLKNQAIGIVELRNQVGTGHGRVAATTLTGTHPGRMAVDVASSYCGALLAIHAEYSRRSTW